MTATRPPRTRWLAAGVFLLYTALNFLDRQALAALAPSLRAEFHLSNEDYGWLLAAFSIAYSASSVPAGLLIDRLGLHVGAILTLSAWSTAGLVTGLVGSFSALAGCRAALGAAEAGGVPAYGKANALYLRPEERSLGAALNQVGISLGSVAAPLLAGYLAVVYGWRSAFVVAGLLGFLWIPLWLWVRRRLPAVEDAHSGAPMPIRDVLADRRFWGLCAANVLAMATYSLWSNWTTVFLVDVHRLSPDEVNRRLAWIPPLAATLGGLSGGWLALRWAVRSRKVQRARLLVCAVSGVALLATAWTPRWESAALATAGISLSYFFTLAMSVNIYAIPLDLYGAGRAAFAVSALTLAYGLMQTGFSPLVGALVDRYGFGVVCAGVAAAPLAACGVLWAAGVGREE